MTEDEPTASKPFARPTGGNLVGTLMSGPKRYSMVLAYCSWEIRRTRAGPAFTCGSAAVPEAAADVCVATAAVLGAVPGIAQASNAASAEPSRKLRIIAQPPQDWLSKRPGPASA